MSILNPLFEAVAWVLMKIHAGLAVPFGADSGWAWGLSIVFLVVLMRLIMVPLFVKQVRSQQKMMQHMPQLQELRKRYKNDKQKLNEETMKFYKENGVNPLGGCLPLVAQLPVFWSLFNVLKAVADWTPGHVPSYGLTVAVVESARKAHVFGVLLSDRFLFEHPAPAWSSRLVILAAVAVSVVTTFLTMRQSQKRGMLQQGPPDPDNPMANTQKYMMYIAPLFALSSLYWQFGLVIYWVTTNVWTLGQQHFLYRNLPVVGSTTVGASALQPAGPSANQAATGSGKSSTGKPSTGKPSAGKATGKTTGKTAQSKPASGTSGPGKPAAARAGASGNRAETGTARTRTSSPNGSPASAASSGSGSMSSRLRLGRSKPQPEPEPEPVAPPSKVVRNQPVKKTRSQRSGKR